MPDVEIMDFLAISLLVEILPGLGLEILLLEKITDERVRDGVTSVKTGREDRGGTPVPTSD